MPSLSSATENAISLWDKYPDMHDRFEFVKLLGEGAGGVVFQVRDRNNDYDEVALKILIDREAFDEQTVRRFREELKISQQLCHPSAIRGYEVIETEDTLAFTMEVVNGLDLGKIFRSRALTHDEIDYIFTQVLGALRELHGKGILHRDIKMENIMVSDEGDVKLSDLGLSKQYGIQLTRTGVLLGTAQYLPPEYIRKGRFDARGDIYALGIAIFELFYGMRWMVEYSGPEAIEILLQNNFELPLNELKDIPKKYRYIIKKCTALSVDQRFQSAAEVIEAFRKPLDYTFFIDDKAVLKQSTHVVDDTVRARGMVESTSYSPRPNIVIKLLMIMISSSIIIAMSVAGSLAIPSVREYVVKQAYTYRNSLPPKVYDVIMRLPVPNK